MTEVRDRNYVVEPGGVDTDSPRMSADELFRLQQQIERDEAEARLRRDARIKALWNDYAAPGAIITAILAVLIGSPILLWWGFIRTEQVPGEVIARAWIWEAPIETYKAVDGRTWYRSQVPGDAYNRYQRVEQSGSICVATDPDGWCTMSVPTYDTRYYYTVDRWRESGALKVRSRSDAGVWADPHRPDASHLVDTGVLGSQRANWGRERLELRTVFVTTDHGVAQWVAYEPDRALWDELLVGDEGQLAMTGFSRIRGVSR